MTSSRRSLGRASYRLSLPGLGEVALEAVCTRYTGRQPGQGLALYIPARLCPTLSFEEAAAAALTAYMLHRRGLGRAKNPGLEALRIICRTRSLGEAARRCGPQPGEDALLILVYAPGEEASAPRPTCTCTMAEPDPLRVTEAAVFALEERLYRAPLWTTRSERLT